METGTSNDAPRTSRRRKFTKLKRGQESFRPGGVVVETIPKTLNFLIPGSDGNLNDQEMTEVKDLANALAQASGLEMQAVGMRNKVWEIRLRLQAVEQSDDDQLLSEAFRALNDTIVGVRGA